MYPFPLSSLLLSTFLLSCLLSPQRGNNISDSYLTPCKSAGDCPAPLNCATHLKDWKYSSSSDEVIGHSLRYSSICNSPNQCSPQQTCFIHNSFGHDRPYSHWRGYCVPCASLPNQSPTPNLVDITNCDAYSPVPNPQSKSMSHQNSCNSSADCEVNDICSAMLTDGTISACKSKSISSPFKTSCFCLDLGITCSSSDDCQLNKDCVQLKINEASYSSFCLDCSSIETVLKKPTSEVCNVRHKSSSPSNGKNATILQNCYVNRTADGYRLHPYSNCKGSAICMSLTNGGRFRDCRANSYDPGCFCLDYTSWDDTENDVKSGSFCSFLRPCIKNNVCVRMTDRSTPVCVPPDAVRYRSPKPNQISVMPFWIPTAVFGIEMCFTLLKTVTINYNRKNIRLMGAIFFVIESVAGLYLTVHLSIKTVFTSQKSDQVNGNIGIIIIISSLFFIVSEMLSAISEGTNVHRKAFSLESNDTAKDESSAESSSFSLRRRVFSKWLSFFMSISALATQQFIRHFDEYYDKSFHPIFIYFTIIFNIFLIVNSMCNRSRLWTRIIASSCLFSTVIVFSLFSVISKINEVDCEHPFYFHPDVGTAILIFSGVIMNCATSALGLKGYQESNGITEEQVEFVETAMIGISGPLLVISLTPTCLKDARTILIVGFPQVIVLLGPLLFEYVQILFQPVQTVLIKYISG